MTKHIEWQKAAIEAFLEAWGEPETPKAIAEYLYGKGTRSNRIYGALNSLLAEGKIIRHRGTGIQNEPVRIEWNKDWKPRTRAETQTAYNAAVASLHEPVKPAPQSKFTVGSVWKSQNGKDAIFIARDDELERPLVFRVGNQIWTRQLDGKHCSKCDGSVYPAILLDSCKEPEPEAPVQSELREVFHLWRGANGREVNVMLMEAIITAIERLSAKVEQPKAYTLNDDGFTWDAVKPKEAPKEGKRSGEVWVNIYKNPRMNCCFPYKEEADLYAEDGRLACVPVSWTEGQGI